MITQADVGKLLSIRCAQPSVLSLYLRVEPDPPALRSLPARAEALIGQAERGMQAAAGEHREIARRLLEIHARQWLGHTVAIFACGEPRLAEALVLPGGLEDRAVLAGSPHVRPLLLALQRWPQYYLAVVARQRAWVFRVAGDRVDRLVLPSGAAHPGFGGWCSLEAHRRSDHLPELVSHPYRDLAIVLGPVMRGDDGGPLVIGGREAEVGQFLAALPDDARGRFAGTAAADPATVSVARMTELAGQLMEDWTGARERRLAGLVRDARDGKAAAGLQECLAAVNEGAAGLLIVPDSGMMPGYACQRCGKLSHTGTDCPDWGCASAAVPDLIEEMAVRVLDDGGEVAAVGEPPGGVAALLRFPVTSSGSASAAAA